MMNVLPGRPANLSDVAMWAQQHRSIDDQRALARVEKLWENVPLANRSADPAAFEAQFPLHGFDPERHKSEPAYKSWRRKVLAVMRDFQRQSERKPEQSIPQSQKVMPDAEQQWFVLLDVISGCCYPDDSMRFVQQRLIPIKKLARLAGRAGYGPKDLTAARFAELGANLDFTERDFITRGLRNLNRMRSVPEIVSFLPDEPYALSPSPRKHVIADLPEVLSKEIQVWLDVSCSGELDPVSGEMMDSTSKSDRTKKDVALRRFCDAALTANPDLRGATRLADLITFDIAVVVLRRWLADTGRKRLTERSIFGYLSSIRTVAGQNGVDIAFFKSLEDKVSTVKKGKEQSEKMSARVQKFCEALIGNKALQTRMMTLHIRVRRVAQSLIDRAEDAGRPLSATEVTRIRQLGAVAVFCAIETCAVPLRIENVMRLRFRGPHADLLMPTAAKASARILLPAKNVKNAKKIDATLAQDYRNGLDTVMWFITNVRPLFPHASESDYLLPAVDRTGHLDKKLFRIWFKKISRSFGIPMLPHNFRHGLASLVIHSHPGQHEAVAVLLGDTESTVRKYYAWINEKMRIEAAQNLVLELARAA